MAEIKGSITLINVEDGDSSVQSVLSVVQEELLLFYAHDKITDEDTSFYLENNNFDPPALYTLNIAQIIGNFLIGGEVEPITSSNVVVQYLNITDEGVQEWSTFTNLSSHLSVENNIYSIDVYGLIKSEEGYQERLFNSAAGTEALRLIVTTENGTGEKVLFINYGLNEDLATFTVSAGSINALVRNTSLVFDGNGLTINNGAFTINGTNLDGNPVPLLSYIPPNEETQTDGYLSIVGGGSFTGTVYAEDGYFRGEVHATSGTFSNVTIGEDATFAGSITGATGSFNSFRIGNIKFAAPDLNDPDFPYAGIYHVDYDSESPQKFYISNQGDIYAESITLGNKAKIENYIEFDYLNTDNETYHAYIYNPNSLVRPDVGEGTYSTTDGKFIETRSGSNVTFLLTADGILSLGNGTNQITLDGSNSTISGNTWSITPNVATFNNIVASGRIETAVFEYNKVQAMGGQMYFKPSVKIKEGQVSGENLEVVIDGDISVKENDWVEINGNFFQVISQDGSILTLTGNVIPEVSTLNSQTLILYGDPELDIIIGINSTSSEYIQLPPQSLAFVSFNTSEDEDSGVTQLYFEKNLVLGNLDGIENCSGFGLYGDNVFLKGRLTTESNTGGNRSYAGVNTDSEDAATFSILGQTHTEYNQPIIFWAGAESSSTDDIEKSPFQVTSSGYLYASGGYFTGTVISDSLIQAAEIATSIITGTGTKPAILITGQETDKAILFGYGYREEDENGDFLRTIKQRYFEVNTNSVILGKDFTIYFDESEEYDSTNIVPGITQITSNAITSSTLTLRAALDSNMVTYLTNEFLVFRAGTANAGLIRQEDGISLHYFIKNNDDYLENTSFIANKDGFSLEQSLRLQNNSMFLGTSNKVEYRPREDGYYDIYILE